MKFEVGKKYRTRGDEVVTLLEINRLGAYPLLGVDSRGQTVTWTEDGCFLHEGQKYALDLLAEHTDSPPPARRKLPTPDNDADRKAMPLWDGCIRYFPSALLEVARHSKISNEQHNPGQPMHWAQEKSTDQHNTAGRHLIDADATEGTEEEIVHLRAAAWRVLARLQMACQRHGAPIAPAARLPEEK